MSLILAVHQKTTVRVWHRSRDSRVGIASEIVPGLFAVQLLNQPNLPYLKVPAVLLEEEWLEAPRIDVAWMNVGSVWVKNELHKFWNKPVPKNDVVILRRPIGNGGTIGYEALVPKEKGGNATGGALSCYNFMHKFTRLWGAETKKGVIPDDPMPYLWRKLPGRPKKPKPEPQSAFSRLLEKELIPE
jgi:hypothetical protein